MVTPVNEQARLESLINYAVLDTDFEESFDRITRLAAKLFDTEISVVSLVDKDRQWFKSVVGLDARETPRNIAFCAHAILNDEVFEISDAQEDDRFKSNPLVTGAPFIRFYAGAPLKSSDGHNLGTFCIIDSDDRKPLNKVEKEVLEDFSKLVVELLETRKIANESSMRFLKIDQELDILKSSSNKIKLTASFAGQLDINELVDEIRTNTKNITTSLEDLKTILNDLPKPKYKT
jgi:two-component system, sensor histidine kinase